MPTPWFGRRRPYALLLVWVASLALAGLLWWTSHVMPALEELLQPGYWLIAIIAIALTLRWMRPRSGDRRRGERREGERRVERSNE